MQRSTYPQNTRQRNLVILQGPAEGEGKAWEEMGNSSSSIADAAMGCCDARETRRSLTERMTQDEADSLIGTDPGFIASKQSFSTPSKSRSHVGFSGSNGTAAWQPDAEVDNDQQRDDRDSYGPGLLSVPGFQLQLCFDAASCFYTTRKLRSGASQGYFGSSTRTNLLWQDLLPAAKPSRQESYAATFSARSMAGTSSP